MSCVDAGFAGGTGLTGSNGLTGATGLLSWTVSPLNHVSFYMLCKHVWDMQNPAATVKDFVTNCSIVITTNFIALC